MIPTKELSLSVLDFGESDSPAESIWHMIEYAMDADILGFQRFWMGEHYIANTVFSNPEPLIPLIAAKTKRLQVGAAGLLARDHSLRRVACSFSLLEKIFPHRIDLGIVAPSIQQPPLTSSPKATSTKEIFHELLGYFKTNINIPGVYPDYVSNFWHMTGSIKSYNSCQHDLSINIAKSLIHNSSNMDPEFDEICHLKEREQKNARSTAKITITIGCFVSYDRKRLTGLRNFYKGYLPGNVLKMCIICHPNSLSDQIEHISDRYQTNDITILNLGTSYEEKSECLKIISQVLHLNHAF